MPKTYTINPDVVNGYWVHSHGEYPESSVLAGQYRRCKEKWFETLEEAQAAYPAASVSDSPALPYSFIAPSVPDIPYPGFDPLDAGERWDDE